MEIIRGTRLNAKKRDVVLTIGKFESIHLGHRALIEKTVSLAKHNEMVSAVMVFEPHPNIFFGNASYRPIFTEEERVCLLKNLEVDYFLVQPFDENFATIAPENFCDIIFSEIHAKIVVVGEDYRFGHERAGTVSMLQAYAKNFNAIVNVIPARKQETFAISTSNIRHLLAENNLPEANKLLGPPFFIRGTTQQGQQLGRKLGFPTLNIYPNEGKKFLPSDGVYVTQTTIDNKTYDSVTNIGLRPTITQQTQLRSVETHLLSGALSTQDFYNQPIKVAFLAFIRPEENFSSLDALKLQIQRDLDTANHYFKGATT